MRNYEKDFDKVVRKALKSQGIRITGATWVPDTKGNFTRGETAYYLRDRKECLMLRSYSDILDIARGGSWNIT